MKTKEMTDEEICKAATDYVARHEHDNCQIYTTPECNVFRDEAGDAHCQIWVMLPKELEKADW